MTDFLAGRETISFRVEKVTIFCWQGMDQTCITVVPELIAETCRPDLIAPAVLDVLENPGEQAAAMAETMQALGLGGEAPGLRAARAVLDGLGRRA